MNPHVVLTCALTLLAAAPLAPLHAELPATQPATQPTSPASASDDVDRMLAQVDVPARFADHTPQWSIEEFEQTFQELEGAVTWKFWALMDGDRVAAYTPRDGFHAGVVFVPDFRPDHAPTLAELQKMLPTERWHIETTVGSQLRTDAWIPTEATKDTLRKEDFHIDGDRLTLTRHYQGTTKFNKWTHRDKQEQAVDVTNTATLRVDPQLGYVVTVENDALVERLPKQFEWGSAATSGRHVSWPDEVSCYRVAISNPTGDGLYGYASNMINYSKHDRGLKTRDGAVVAFLNDQTGWSPATTVRGAGKGTIDLIVCNPHTDHDFTLMNVGNLDIAENGKHRLRLTHRMMALPPELTKHAWHTMDLLHKGETGVLLRLGRLDDFEDQPLDMTDRERGQKINAAIATDVAKSGSKSLKFEKTAGVGSPTLILRPGRHYIIEGDFKLVPDPGAAAGDVKAGMELQYQQWPGAKVGDQPNFTAYADPKEEGWQHLKIELEAPAWGPAVDLVFRTDGATMYLDNFRFDAVK